MAPSEAESKNPPLEGVDSHISPTMASVDRVGEETEDEAQFVNGLRLAVVLASTISIALLIMLDMSIIATATPNITSEFHSVDDVGCLFEVGSLICATSTSSSMFIIGRAIAGMGSSGVGNGAATILSASVPLAKRPTYFGIVASCFYINLPVGGLAMAALIFVPLPKYSLRRAEPTMMTFTSLFHDLDIVGFLLFSPALVMFLLALEWGGSTYSWGSPIVIGLFCGSAGNIALFLAWEYNKGRSAMIPLELLRKRVMFCSCLTLFFLYANSLITSYYLAIYFQGVRNKPPTLSGVFMLPGVIGQMTAGILSGLAVTRLGYYLPSTVLGTVLAAVGAGLMSTFTPSTSTATWICYQIIAGVGRGCALQMVDSSHDVRIHLIKYSTDFLSTLLAK
ncbi:hypothetical protein UA08_07126 [Talaromyces atroroseus]|uniref:Major facilitator superfamily (MFS) profile domain-containing protein n=1 Tax=Talaromyces atroroseus TaxID=1441469 RepID=A0A225AKG9_TALAT|nr:hypothetical protein UA08_07126 [Talaromyces atroroseus]OKL57718.1 hypothetical protein UA08_07126 [Talaromyces atroroseus]